MYKNKYTQFVVSLNIFFFKKSPLGETKKEHLFLSKNKEKTTKWGTIFLIKSE